MKSLDSIIQTIQECFQERFNMNVRQEDIQLDPCKKEFTGDFTFVTFPWAKKLARNPEILAAEIGDYLKHKLLISEYNVVKGFLNFSLPEIFWIEQLSFLINTTISKQLQEEINAETYLIEYCSPNTNKPLHLGHIRNILLGWSLANILKSLGHHVSTTQVVNDRGIAICKSMVAWKKFGHGATPASVKMKGDHFVGDYYVLFEKKFKEEYEPWQSSPDAIMVFNNQKKPDEDEATFFARYKNEYFNKFSILGKEARELLLLWEKNEPGTKALWGQMNQWVYDGFESTFKNLGVTFDSNYYESQTYLLGKDIVDNGLRKNVFYREADQSVWINLEDRGLDKKVILRSDGTSMYITQDLGTATQRHEQHQKQHYIYVVADEQDYHFKVLFETLKKLGEPFADKLYHLSYGMIDLPTGKMKSREGTVVDADDIIQEVIDEARNSAEDRGELAGLTEEQRQTIFNKIGLAALKYFILKVAPKKRMIFDPKESVDMQGHTGPYIANAYVRIKSIERKEGYQGKLLNPEQIMPQEKELISLCMQYKDVMIESASTYDPSHLANYLYTLAKEFHRYYHDHRILNAETSEIKQWRLAISHMLASHLLHGMTCLGIDIPDRM
ncbi:MAG: arginine--tRNA ligase [Bacteroidota bacterium]|nr:arginine--tRNA ligase [Bacteroidota bacterium]